MKLQKDQHKSESSFQIGEWVFLKLQAYRQTSISNNQVPKLTPKFYKPFKVVDKEGVVAYKLELLVKAQIHNVFHVSQLKKVVGYIGQYSPLPSFSNQVATFEPLAILKRKMVKRDNIDDFQLLIHWKDLSSTEATWEFSSKMRKRFPQFSLEDKGF